MNPSNDSDWAALVTGTSVDRQGTQELNALLAQADVLLADLESRSLDAGKSAALPFLGLARFELSETNAASELPLPEIPPTYEARAAHVEQLLSAAIRLSPSLEGCLHVLRAQGLLREHHRWARRRESKPTAPSPLKPLRNSLGVGHEPLDG